jgi:hypothetical protein
VVVAGVVAIAGIVAFMAVMQVSNAQNVAFKQSWNSVKFKIGELTSQYQTEEGKWKAGQHSNAEMAGIVDQYLPRYQQLIDEANAIQTPERYLQARDLLVQSIEAEKESNVHFKNYLLTGDQQENRKASDLLSLSLKYELESSGAMSAAG